MNTRTTPLRPPIQKPAPTVKLTSVKSSFITGIAHEAGTLHVKMKSGETYEFPGVSAEEHQALAGAESIGKHFTKHFRGRKFTRRSE